jgi:hypothetical protein
VMYLLLLSRSASIDASFDRDANGDR